MHTGVQVHTTGWRPAQRLLPAYRPPIAPVLVSGPASNKVVEPVQIERFGDVVS